MSLSLSTLIGHMGGVALVVAVLLVLMSAVSLTVAFERQILFRRTSRLSARFVREVAGLLGEGRVNDALTAARAHPDAHLARVLAAGLDEFQRKRRFVQLPFAEAIEAARRGGERASAVVTTELRRGTGALATIGATAPFVGLFGTVIGIVNAFADMARAKAGGIEVVAAGISEALVTTALGLLVALPAVWFHNALVQRVERFQVEMSNASSSLLDLLVEHSAGHDARPAAV